VYFTSSIPLPFSNDGVRFPGDGDTNIASCPGPFLNSLPLLPGCPDLSMVNDPSRTFSLHAVDAATGRVDWRAVSLPSYGAASYTNGVLFDPMTTAFAEVAYDAETGLPLWSFPLGAAPASGAAITGNSIVVGAGVSDAVGLASTGGAVFPPQATGIWSFTNTGPPTGSLPLASSPQIRSYP
jgi:outer membrane protein assembly factor BamB